MYPLSLSLSSPKSTLLPRQHSFTFSTSSFSPSTSDYEAGSSSYSQLSSLTSFSSHPSPRHDQILESGYYSEGQPVSPTIYPNCCSLSDLSPLLATLKAVTFDFCLRVDRIRVSWREADWHRLDQYQLRAYLLLDEHDEETSPDEATTGSDSADSEESKKRHSLVRKRKHDQKLLATLTASRTLTLSTNGDTEICFDDSAIPFQTHIPVEHKRPEALGKSDRQYIFRSRVVRLKLERLKHGHTVGSQHQTIGFVDLDLAQLRQSCLNPANSRADGFLSLPMVLFADYNRHIVRHQMESAASAVGSANFTFDIRLKLDSAPLDIQDLALNLDMWISAESLIGGQAMLSNGSPGALSSTMFSTSSSSSQSLYLSQLLLRRDSLPQMSKDKELKYHESPPTSRTQHLLNLFGILPPGQLYRVSIHFGQIDQLDEMLYSACDLPHCVPKKLTTAPSSIYASFEVKHHQHQPTIFHQHHQRSSICCRTRQLTSDQIFAGKQIAADSAIFDQNFTFFERFHYRDSPPTVLSIRSGITGKKLFAFKCHLAEYVHCRSVNQYFTLQGKKPGQVCRLQFSIAVKPVQELS